MVTDPARCSVAPFTAVGAIVVVDDGFGVLEAGVAAGWVTTVVVGAPPEGVPVCAIADGATDPTAPGVAGDTPRLDAGAGGAMAVLFGDGGGVVVGHRLAATEARGASSWLVPRPLPKRHPSTAPSVRTWVPGPLVA
jgi:hypothetical protein